MQQSAALLFALEGSLALGERSRRVAGMAIEPP